MLEDSEIDRAPAPRTSLPEKIAANRALHKQIEEAVEDLLRPRTAALLTAAHRAADELERLHRRYADRTDLDPTSGTRAAAMWLLSARVIALFRGTLSCVVASNESAALAVWRTAHEAGQVLLAFGSPGPKAAAVVRKWLADDGPYGYVRQGEARAATEDYRQELAASMLREGFAPVGSSVELTKTMYDHLSRVAHNRRSSCLNAYAPDLRQANYGPHSSAEDRYDQARWTISIAHEACSVVGDALRALYGRRQFYSEVVRPIEERMEAVARQARVSQASIDSTRTAAWARASPDLRRA